MHIHYTYINIKVKRSLTAEAAWTSVLQCAYGLSHTDAASGDPNGGDVPRWDQYRKGEYGTMVFDRQSGMKYGFDRVLIRRYEENTDFVNAFMHARRR